MKIMKSKDPGARFQTVVKQFQLKTGRKGGKIKIQSPRFRNRGESKIEDNHLSCEVLEDGGEVDRSAGADALGVFSSLEKPSDTTDGKLETGLAASDVAFLAAPDPSVFPRPAIAISWWFERELERWRERFARRRRRDSANR